MKKYLFGLVRVFDNDQEMKDYLKTEDGQETFIFVNKDS